MQVQSLGWEDPLEEKMAANSSILAWRIPWTERSSRLHSPRGHKESDTTEYTHIHAHCWLLSSRGFYTGEHLVFVSFWLRLLVSLSQKGWGGILEHNVIKKSKISHQSVVMPLWDNSDLNFPSHTIFYPMVETIMCEGSISVSWPMVCECIDWCHLNFALWHHCSKI